MDLAKNWAGRSNRLRSCLENSGVKDFIIGRSQKSVEFGNQCGKLDNSFFEFGKREVGWAINMGESGNTAF